MTNEVRSVSTNVSPAQLPKPNQDEELKKKFGEFVGETFYRQLFKAMRASTGKNAYLNGGQAEKMFQSQLDDLLIQQMSQSRGGSLSAELFAQYQRQTKSQTPQSPSSGNMAPNGPLSPLE